MSIHQLIGHQKERIELGKAVRADRLPQLLLICGPSGVGKQRLALWLAQLVFCQRAGAEPCGECGPCRQVLGLSHPDLHWFIPVPRPKAAEPEKQVEEIEDALRELMAERRKQSLYGPPDGLSAHFVSTARLLQRQAGMTPVQGRRKVFILGNAERLVPQESSQEAANSLLKLFEEPPADSIFILTTTDPNALLPTIRSRSVPFRIGRVPDVEVESFLAASLEPALSAEGLRERVKRCRGAIGVAIAEDEGGSAARRAAAELMKCVLDGAVPTFERVLKQGTWSARGDFTALLDALGVLIAEAVRRRATAGSDGSEMASSERTVGLNGLVRASERVAKAREVAQGNVNPQLILATLCNDLAEVL
ncbi:MAG: DNA polymerase III subunit [Gemmatimonadota bacterium]